MDYYTTDFYSSSFFDKTVNYFQKGVIDNICTTYYKKQIHNFIDSGYPTTAIYINCFKDALYIPELWDILHPINFFFGSYSKNERQESFFKIDAVFLNTVNPADIMDSTLYKEWFNYKKYASLSLNALDELNLEKFQEDFNTIIAKGFHLSVLPWKPLYYSKQGLYLACMFERVMAGKNSLDIMEPVYQIHNYLKNREIIKILEMFINLSKEDSRKIIVCIIMFKILTVPNHTKDFVTELDLITQNVKCFTKFEDLILNSSYLSFELIFMFIHYLDEGAWFNSFLIQLLSTKNCFNLIQYNLNIMVEKEDILRGSHLLSFDFYKNHAGFCNAIRTTLELVAINHFFFL